MKVVQTTISALTLMAILAVLAGAALADDTPPAQPTVSVPAVTQPAETTTVDPADAPVQTMVPLPDLVPTSPVTTPAVTPDPIHPVQGLLVKQVKLAIGVFMKKRSHWAKLLHLRLAPIGNLNGLTSLKNANKVLAKTRAQSRSLHRRWMSQRIIQLRANIDHQRRVMGLRLLGRTLANSGSLGLRLARTRRLAAATYQQFRNPPHKQQFLCIHHYEGSWTDTGSPFWGGLQMDYTFQAGYGGLLLRSKGTADHWTPLEQIWVAERAVVSRGFYPWPNTARYCGLI